LDSSYYGDCESQENEVFKIKEGLNLESKYWDFYHLSLENDVQERIIGLRLFPPIYLNKKKKRNLNLNNSFTNNSEDISTSNSPGFISKYMSYLFFNPFFYLSSNNLIGTLLYSIFNEDHQYNSKLAINCGG
jgi:hypothetical protein